MKAIILAAGRGQRMMPLTAAMPKPLLEVAGKPLLQYHIEKLCRAGISDIVINHSYLGQQLEDYFGDGHHLDVNISWSAEKVALETAGGIKQALSLLGTAPFLAINGDVWSDINYCQLIQGQSVNPLKNQQHLAHLVLIENPSQNKKGDFGLENGVVSNHSECMWTFSGVALYHPNIVTDCPAGVAMSLTPLLRKAAFNGQVSGELFTGDWQDIGTPERLKALQDQLTSV